MTSIRRVHVALIVLLAGMGLGTPLWAQDGAEEESIDAYAEFQRANQLASWNALTRAIPHYKKVIKAEPRRFPLAQFNLAEVYRVKGECGPAVFYYQSYRQLGSDEGALSDAQRGVEQCLEGEEPARLTVLGKPEGETTVKINGALFTDEGEVDAIKLMAGEYEIEASAEDHLPGTKKVELKAGEVKSVQMELVRKTYFGGLMVQVDQEGATLEVKPLSLDAPNDDEGALSFEVKTPMSEAKRLPTGKYSILVNKEGWDRWIRYVRVEREQTTTVDVTMMKAMPSELR